MRINKMITFIIIITIQMFCFMPIANSIEEPMTKFELETDHELIPKLTPLSIENETLLKHNMNLKVQLDYTIKIVSTFVLTNNDSLPIDFFLLTINKTITSVFCDDPLGPLDFTWTVDPAIGNIINITMRYPLISNDAYVFLVSYQIENAIYFVDGVISYYGLDFEVIHPRNTINFELELCLPVYAELLAESPPEPIFPNADKVFEENEIVIIIWYLENRDYNENNVFLIRFIQESDNQQLNNNKAIFYVLSILGGIIIGALGVFLISMIRKKPVEKQLVTSLLTDTEQEVIKAINADSGISTQRRICDKTGYSKSKVSQILAKLEEKKVLKRERWGRTNKVTIINPSFKQLGSSIEPKEKSSEL